ncbi:hypothetical protein JI58_09620 [Marinosulfonomonas sp. PRT-SC04]|nr:hypothetical protein JI58_09620 [Marinosulfonomonas sp. PRT-SC04]
MKTGYYISGIGHGILLAWALFGHMFSSVPEEDLVVVSEVSIISSEEFAALSTPQPSPTVEPTPPRPPAVRPEPVAPTPPVDEAPDVIETPPPLEEVVETPPPVVQPPVEVAPAVQAPLATTASPRPAPRVAPTPVEAPPPDTVIADDVQEVATPDTEAPTESQITEATAPEEANDRIVTEADEPASSAPTRSSRPSVRPSRATPPVETATATSSTRDAIADALAGVQQEAVTTSAPVGPPLSYGDKDALRVAVSNCWHVDVGSASSRVTVVVGVTLEKTGKVVANSLRLVSSKGGDDTAVNTAFQNARRAIIICQKGGYKLPVEKYSHWREIEMTFNPDKMRVN